MSRIHYLDPRYRTPWSFCGSHPLDDGDEPATDIVAEVTCSSCLDKIALLRENPHRPNLADEFLSNDNT